jgi:cobalt-zinc-cadmium efflux system membrane fusion protein
MPPWLHNLIVWCKNGVPALLTLAALAGVGFWGYRNDWTLPSLAQLGGKSESPEKAEPEATVRVVGTGPRRIEFPSEDAVKKTGIDVKPAEARTLGQYVTANGTVDYDPGSYARLTARASGSVWKVYKEIGDVLHKGDVLALLDAAEVGKAKADFLQSLTQVKTRTAALEQLRAAGREGAVPDRSLREAETALREARIRLFNDQQQLLNLGLPIRLKEVEDVPEDRLTRHLRLLGLPDAVTRELDPETLTANLLPLTAPFDGVVVVRDTAPGEVVQGTAPKTLFIVADVRRLHVDLAVNQEDMAQVRVGQPVTFETASGTLKAAGEVSHISPEVDEKTRRVVVHAEVPNPDGRLRPNAFGNGRIRVGERPNAVVVPGEAVQADGGTALVFVRTAPTVFEVRTVRTGLRDGDLVEVTGVRRGEEVVTAGSFALKSELLKDRIPGGDE